MKNVLSAVMVAIFVMSNGSFIVAQRKPTSKRPSERQKIITSSNPTASAYSSQPFDLTIGKLPPYFHGHNPEIIYKILELRNKSREKGEFETTKEFNLRIQSEQARPIFGELTINSIFAFECDELEAVYDADKQILQVAAKLGSVLDNAGRDNRRSLALKASYDNNTYYKASNAFGAQVTVKRSHSEHYEVAILNYKDLEVSRYIEKMFRNNGITSDIFAEEAYMANIKMDAQSARRTKENVRLLLILKLKLPFTTRGAIVSSPTISEPNDIFREFYYLNAELIEVWFYDVVTGEVLEKKKATVIIPKVDSQPPKQYGLSEDERKQAYIEVTDAKNRAAKEASQRYSPTDPKQIDAYIGWRNILDDKYMSELANKYHVTKVELFLIYDEGRTKNWPITK